MGLFGNPKCPRCGGKTVRTNYAFPFPQLRCNRCCEENGRLKAMEDEIKELKKKLK